MNLQPEPNPATKPCPFCGETIRLSAIKCRFCNEMLTGLRPGDEVIAVTPQARNRALTPGPQVQPVPGTPTAIPVEPRTISIAIGLALVGLAAWMVTSWIPDHRPMSESDWPLYAARCGKEVWDTWDPGCLARLDPERWLTPEQYRWAYVIAGLIGVLGLKQIIDGATYRAFREVTCHRCKTKVVGKKTFNGIQCPLGPHLAEQHVGKFVVIILVIILLVMLNR